MRRMITLTLATLALPGAAFAATRTYPTGTFESVSVAAGIMVDVELGPTHSVVAENSTGNFDDLQISVEGDVLRVERPSGNWFTGVFSGSRPDYRVHVVTPVLRSLATSSGANAAVKGSVEGNFSAKASSGSEIDVSLVKGGDVKASASSGSDIEVTGTCVLLEVEASSGSDVDAEDLTCDSVIVRASSGSDISVAATKQVTGTASSGSDISIRGRPPVVQVDKSSGANVSIRD